MSIIVGLQEVDKVMGRQTKLEDEITSLIATSLTSETELKQLKKVIMKLKEKEKMREKLK